MKFYEIAGWLGVLLFQTSTWFQFYKTLRLKKVEQISLPFWICILLGCVGYMIYAVEIKATVYIWSNIFGMISSLTYLITYLYYRRRKC